MITLHNVPWQSLRAIDPELPENSKEVSGEGPSTSPH